MIVRIVFFLLLLALSAVPMTFSARMGDDHATEPYRKAQYYDSLAMPDSALYWLDKVVPARLPIDKVVRYYLLKASQLRQLKRFDEAWKLHDSVVALLVQADPTPDLAAEAEFLKGRLFNDRGNYLGALQSFESAEKLIDRSQTYDTGLLIRILNFKSIANYYTGDLNASAEALIMAETLAKNTSHVNPLDFADVLQNLAIVYSNMSLFDSAYVYIVKARAMKEKALPRDDPAMISFYVNYGRFLQMTGRVDEGLFYFNYAEELLKDKKGFDFINGSLHINLGNSYQLRGDYDRAIQYFQSAYGYLSQSQGSGHPKTITALSNLAFMYIRTAQPDSALNILTRLSKSQLTPALIIRVNRNLAHTYRSLQRFDEAKAHISTSIHTAAQYLGIQHFEYAYSVFEKAMIEVAMKDFEAALASLLIAEQSYAAIFPETDEEYINVLRIKAFVLSRMKRFHEADRVFMVADSLLGLLNQNKEQIESGLPRYLSFRNANLLIDKARMYQEWYEAIGEIDKLAASVELYSRSLSIYEQYSQFASDESRLILGDNMRGTYEDAVRASWELYSLMGDQRNLDLAFGFAGRAKSSVLLSSIRKLQAFEAAGVPVTTTDTERRLRLEIHSLTRAAAEERLKPKPNISRIAFLDAKRIEFTRAYDSLMQQIEARYPDYYALRYAPTTLTIQQVQQNIRPDQAMIEYFFEKDHLYIFALRSDSLLVMRNPISNDFTVMVETLRNNILGNLMYHGTDEYHSFLRISTALYKELVSPLEGFISNKRLVVVPDGILGYLPFELLINPASLRPEHYEGINYSTLPYMLRTFPLSYLSSSALTKSFNSTNGLKDGSLLAMAPDYNQAPRSQNRMLTPLPYALKEAETVHKIWGGVLLAGHKATKKAFLEMAPGFGLLHLAMHTLLDDENPLFSKLIFQPDDTASSSIFGYELYALRFKASMVVLSACNSGIGKLRSAEGLMSLSRTFMYAGAQAVLMTSWEVNDLSGARLMEIFYHNLADGLPKDLALQQAKISWLSESNQLKSHPFFWAAYQMLGDTQPLQKGDSFLIIFIILGALLLLFATYFVLRRHNRAKFAAKA